MWAWTPGSVEGDQSLLASKPGREWATWFHWRLWLAPLLSLNF